MGEEDGSMHEIGKLDSIDLHFGEYKSKNIYTAKRFIKCWAKSLRKMDKNGIFLTDKLGVIGLTIEDIAQKTS